MVWFKLAKSKTSKVQTASPSSSSPLPALKTKLIDCNPHKHTSLSKQHNKYFLKYTMRWYKGKSERSQPTALKKSPKQIHREHSQLLCSVLSHDLFWSKQCGWEGKYAPRFVCLVFYRERLVRVPVTSVILWYENTSIQELASCTIIPVKLRQAFAFNI